MFWGLRDTITPYWCGYLIAEYKLLEPSIAQIGVNGGHFVFDDYGN